MSLALGVEAGKTVYLNDIPLTVLSVSENKLKMDVIIEGRVFNLNSDDFIEVYPDVFVGVGIPNHQSISTMSRLLIDAPRTIKILRDSNYERNVPA